MLFGFYSPPPFQCFSCIFCHMKIFFIFKVARIFLVILFFSFLRRTLCNTWKSHYRQLQLLKMIFNEKVLVNISSMSNSKNPPWNLLSSVSRITVNECLKNSVQNCFSFALFIIGKTLKTLGFQNYTHLLDLSSLDVSSRGVFRTLSNI